MQHIAYEIFYDYETIQRSSHLHNKLSDQDVNSNINSLPNELETMLSDKESIVSLGEPAKSRSVIVVKSEHSEDVIDERVAKALQGLSLSGNKLKSTSEVIIG